MAEMVIVGGIIVVAAAFVIYRLFVRPSCGCGCDCASHGASGREPACCSDKNGSGGRGCCCGK